MNENDTALVTIKYELFGKFVVLFVRSIGIYLGVFIIVAGEYLFMQLIGWAIFLVMLYRFIDMLLFKQALITEKKFIKEWYFLGSFSLKVGNLQCKKSSTKFGGALLFDEIDNKGQSLFFSVDTLPLNIVKLKEIKKVLLQLHVISKDDCSWIDE